MRASCATGANLPLSRDGRSRTCPCTPYGRHSWLSCSRPCSGTVDGPLHALYRRMVLTRRAVWSYPETEGRRSTSRRLSSSGMTEDRLDLLPDELARGRIAESGLVVARYMHHLQPAA